MSIPEHRKADKMGHETESRKGLQPDRRHARVALLAAVTILLLAVARADAAPAGGNGGNDHHAFKVVDKNGNLVGYTVTENMVAREIENGVWVTFFVHPAVGIYDSGAIYLNYLTTDCSGTSYITHYSTFSEGTRVGSKLYYPKDQQQLTPRSVRVASSSGDGACYPAADIPGVYGVAATVDVNSFGFELPFQAKQ
jgi:hypothetical protein